VRSADTHLQELPPPEGSEGPYADPFSDISSSFDALVEARFRYMQERFSRDDSREAEETYRKTLRAFQRMHGRIVHEYWTSSAPGGVVVTVTRSLMPRISGGSRAHLHRYTDYLTQSFPEAGELLFAGDALAAMCEEVLRGPTQRIALTQVYTAASQLLSSLDALALSPVGEPEPYIHPEEAATAERQAQLAEERARWRLDTENQARELERRRRRSQAAYSTSLTRAERFYRNGAGQSSQFYYFKGLLIGAVIVALLVFGFILLLQPLASLWGLDLSEDEAAAAFAAAIAGSLGASVSVMWRMTAGTFREDAVFGSDNLVRLGAFRPFLGSMFGLILYIALQADMISQTYIPGDPSWYFFIFLAFLAGFSERLVPDFLGSSERGLSRRERHEEEGESAEVRAAAVDDEPSSKPTMSW
jgi:hypothetical protein